MTFLPVPEYRPDTAYLKSDYSDEVQNVFAADGFYMPCPSFNKLTGLNVPYTSYGSIGVRTLSNAILVFIGTEKNLWILRDLEIGFVNVSKSYTPPEPLPPGENGPYSAGQEHRWSFTVFGTAVIATNGADAPQIFDYDNISPTASFRDLGDDPTREDLPEGNIAPIGRTVKNWGNFVAIMDVDASPNTVYWSGLNDADWWTVGQKDCDLQKFYDGGRVVGSSEATNPIIFLQSAIYAATFVPGSDIIFSFQKIHERRGLKSSLSLSSRGSLSFYADEGGFFQINGEGGIVPIGFEKVDRTYFSSINSQNLSQIMGVIDPFYTRVYWALDTEARGIFDQILVYDWELQKWTTIKVRVTSLIPVYSFGVTLEGLDWFCREDDSLPVCNNPEGCEISGEPTPYNPASIERLPYSLDSKVWQSGSPILMGLGIDDNNQPYIGSFNGDNMEASVVSQEMGPTNRQMMRITGIMPVVDNENVLVSAGRRNIANLSTPINWTDEKRQSVNTGFVHLRSRARYHRFRIRIEKGETWSNMTGIDVTAIPAGLR